VSHSTRGRGPAPCPPPAPRHVAGPGGPRAPGVAGAVPRPAASVAPAYPRARGGAGPALPPRCRPRRADRWPCPWRACGAGGTPSTREGRRGAPPHGGRRCAWDWSTRTTPSTAPAAPCRAGPSPGGASDGSHRPGAPVPLAPASAPGPACRPVWGGRGRRARPDLGLDAPPANPHVGRLSGGASTSPPRNSGACALVFSSTHSLLSQTPSGRVYKGTSSCTCAAHAASRGTVGDSHTW